MRAILCNPAEAVMVFHAFLHISKTVKIQKHGNDFIITSDDIDADWAKWEEKKSSFTFYPVIPQPTDIT